jgi:hypothetical protein
VSITPPQRWGEANALQLREGLEEVARQQREGGGPLFQLSCDGVAVVVYGVIAAPQDPVVVGQPVVVKLVGGVEQALPATPAERRHSLRRQRLGHQHVVVHGCDVAADVADQRREAVGGEHHALGPQPAIRHRQHHAVGQLVKRRHR